MDGAPLMVQCPSLKDMLGDKLTAFAPHTTGIPFFKGEDTFFMEIMKQLYDVSSIIDRIDDITNVRKTYNQLAPIELGYRKLDQLTVADVLEDSYNSAMNICHRGTLDPEMNEELAGTLIQNLQLNKLNRIKKISLEAFFYLLEIEKMAE